MNPPPLKYNPTRSIRISVRNKMLLLDGNSHATKHNRTREQEGVLLELNSSDGILACFSVGLPVNRTEYFTGRSFNKGYTKIAKSRQMIGIKRKPLFDTVDLVESTLAPASGAPLLQSG